VGGDEVVDCGVQGVDAAVDAASDLALGKQGEEPLDLLSQDELVGVRWTCQRGRRASQLRISGVLCVA